MATLGRLREPAIDLAGAIRPAGHGSDDQRGREFFSEKFRFEADARVVEFGKRVMIEAKGRKTV